VTGAELLAGLVAHDGHVAELADGEGKGVAAACAALLGSLGGAAVHVAVLDDYLASRDHQRFSPVLAALGVSSGITLASSTRAARTAAYRAEVTYGSYRQFGYDYLDDTDINGHGPVQRGRDIAIVDDADTALIDGGRMSIPVGGDASPDLGLYAAMAHLAGLLDRDVHYELGVEEPAVVLTRAGKEALAEAADLADPDDAERFALDRSLADAIAAREWFSRDIDYAIRDGSLIPGDRMHDLIRLDRGIRQAVEAKEGLQLSPETRIDAQILVRDYYRLYARLGGLTGTAVPASAEFARFYGLGVVRVPAAYPVIRDDLGEVHYRTVTDKLTALIGEVADRHFRGQPVVIGTASSETCAWVSQLLAARNISHGVLQSGQPDIPSVMADAGRLSAVTVIDQAASRGYPLHLGGDSISAQPGATDAAPDDVLATSRANVVAAGGVAALAAERSMSARADDWLAGLAGRHGQPGVIRFYLSAEDAVLGPLIRGGVMGALPRRYPAAVTPASRAGRRMLRMVRDIQLADEARILEFRSQLFSYENVEETQRQQFQALREVLLASPEADDGATDITGTMVITRDASNQYRRLVRIFGSRFGTQRTRGAMLAALNQQWCGHLTDLAYLFDCYDWNHAGADGLGDQFTARAATYFDALLKRIQRQAGLPLDGRLAQP
jgi:preprotein translocase subunit SecA